MHLRTKLLTKNLCEARNTNKKEGQRSTEREMERNRERDGRKEID
jgi:hypothetical protein